MAVLDGSVANVALPTISRELHADASSSIWVVNGYQVVVAMLILPFSSLGDAIGYRRVYTFGIALFTLGSLACALSGTLLVLVIARVLQAVGGAALMSIAPALNRTIFPARMLGVAVGISALTVAASSAAGPTIGGTILAVLPWPWLFAINVPLGIFDTAFALRALPNTPGSGGRVDVPSALLSGPAIAFFIMGLDGFARGFPPAAIVALLAGSAIAGFAFVRRQRTIARPMLPLELFLQARFSLAAATSMLSFVAQGVAFVVLPFLFQTVGGYSPLASGLLFTPWPLAIAFIAPFAGRLSDRYHPPILSTIGLAVFALGLGLLALLPAHPVPLDIVWRAVVCGVGFGFFQAPNNRELMGSVPRERSGNAAGVLATVRTSGQSIGAAIVAILLGVFAAHAAARDIPNAAELDLPAHVALWTSSACAASACLVSAFRYGEELRLPCEMRYFGRNVLRPINRVADDVIRMNASHGSNDDHRFVYSLAALARHPNAAVICALAHGACRQAELVANAGGLNEATLGASLRELDGDGFVSRRVDPGPPLRVLYELTPLGEALATSLGALREWASHHA